MTVWQVFESAAARFADRTAVELQRQDSIDRCSYRQLREAADAWAAQLTATEVRPGDRCALFAANDAAWCATYFAILRVGAVAVPLDTHYSAGQVAAIVRDVSPRVMFVSAPLASIAREALEAFPETQLVDLQVAPSRTPETAVSTYEGHADHPAVILYTLGTAADPKGVVLSNGNLVAERDAVLQVVRVSEEDSVLGVPPLFLLPFAVGARVVFLETFNSTELVRAVSQRRITILACLPQFFDVIHQRVLQEVDGGGFFKRLGFRWLLTMSFRLRQMGLNIGPFVFSRVHAIMGPQFRLFVTGGSKFDPAIGRDLYALGFTILQAYGLTETSGAATLTAPDDAQLDTVGRALPGQQIKVIPADHPEQEGEIAVRGPIVMQGYYKRPEATSAIIHDGWLLSGDLGRLDRDGRLQITGRKEEVIVLASGNRIYPEEVEEHYRRSAYVKEICVVGLAREDEPTTEGLFAVVVADLELMRARRMVNAGDILRFEMEGQSIGLPAHSRVLAYEVSFEPLPRTTTGKLKRHEIARRLRQTRSARQQLQESTTDGRAWADDAHAQAAAAVIVKRARGAVVTADSNLELDLGLDSMERVELLTELEQEFGIRIPEEQAHHIFTVAHLIEAVRPSGRALQAGTTEDSWAVLLRDLPSCDDPVLSGLLARRTIAAPLFYILFRLLRIVMPRIKSSGLEHLPSEGPYIISPNHQGYLDPFIICGEMPYRLFRQMFFVGAAEYFETPFMAWLAKQSNLLPVDPDANLVPAMRAGAFGLTHGKILMLFPEGERSIDGTVKRFKKGASILSRHLNVPIVPVAIRGAYEIWPRNRGINWRVMFPWNRHRVRVAVGRPMRFDNSSGYAVATDQLRAEVEKMWNELG